MCIRDSYNLSEDIGEQTDLVSTEPARVTRMQGTLQTWLAATGARFPTPDNQFDAAKRDARWESIRTKGIGRLEARHAAFLKPDYRPNADWWQSSFQD